MRGELTRFFLKIKSPVESPTKHLNFHFGLIIRKAETLSPTLHSINQVDPEWIELNSKEDNIPDVQVVEKEERNQDNFDNYRFQAGCLMHYYPEWKAQGANNYILKILTGLRLPFYRKPPLIWPSQKTLSQFQTQTSPAMDREIVQMIRDGVLEAVKPSTSFLSKIFLVQKAGGGNRPVFNLRELNKYLRVGSFSLISHFEVPKFIQTGDWLAKIDLSQAYFHVPILPSHHRFLRLVYRGQLFQMKALPFGVACAPKIFATLTNFVAEKLRKKGIRVIVYLDDFLIANQNRHILEAQIIIVVWYLKHLGWNLNYKKSCLHPQRKLEFLGICWNTIENQKFLPEQKIMKIQQEIRKALEKGVCCPKRVKSLLGRLNFASFVVPLGRLHCRRLQLMSRELQRSSPWSSHQLSRAVVEDLKWWLCNVTNHSKIHLPLISNFLTTDAADYGWGAQLNDVTMSGRWRKNQIDWHSNLKELHAIHKALRASKHVISKSAILVQSDNRTALAYLKNEGGTRSVALLEEARKILLFTHSIKVNLITQHLPGKLNTIADRLSRGKEISEWHLSTHVCEKIFQVMGLPLIDLFASERAHVVPVYVSLDHLDPQAAFCNAFSQQWNYQLAWIFPPPSLIPRVLAHLNLCEGKFILIAPRWERTFWRSDLRTRALCSPVKIQDLRSHLVDTTTGRPPPNVMELELEAWLVGGGNHF